ncbi:hypothetical protein TRIUR3_29811 [Triticum urartu]|uniref:Uncharacterized protein n=1 Tax=Triticum urartu TaxID=4572 RepID=M7ZAI0_TRIUA|nr:hypothetical protein TRIUR3_29811 [Triticum urartu]
MCSRDGISQKAILHCNTSMMGSSSRPSSMMWNEGMVEKKEVARTGKPERTSFKCFQCNKTFPTQQAMAGHCSAHTRASFRKKAVARHTNQISNAPARVALPRNPPRVPQHHNVDAIHFWCSLDHISTRSNPVLPLGIRYVPYVRPTSNQVMVTVPYLELHRHSTMTPVMMDPTRNPALEPLAPSPSMPTSTLLGWRAFVPIYSMPSYGVNVAPPSDALSSTNTPKRTETDLTLQLGSGNKHTQKRTLPLLKSLIMASNIRQGANRRCKLATDGVDQGNMGECQADGLDLELHLFR